jgi:arylsulfatase A-like enzyme
MKALLRKTSRLLIEIVSSSKSSFAFLISLSALVLVYRIQLSIGLFTHPVKPFDFNPPQHPVWFTLAYLPYDLLFVLVCFSLSCLLSRMTYLFKQGRAISFLKISGLILLHLVLLMMLLVHGVHGRLLFDVQTGLDTSAIKEAFSNISLMETIKLIEVKDYLFLLFPFGIFWLVFLSPLGLRIGMAKISLLLILFFFSLSVGAVDGRNKKVPDEIRLNPGFFLLSDIAENLFPRHFAEGRNVDLAKRKTPGILLSGSKKYDSKDSAKFLPTKRSHPWNIVFFIMESVGTRYIFDTSHGNPMPMPFLHKISEEGWFLKKHYTTSNVSTKAIFSLFSGFYDFFNRETFGTQAEIGVPAIYNWLGEGYDRFLVTPSSISWYFPTKFIKDSGMREIHSYENLKFEIKEEFDSLGHYIARDEIQTVDFFIQRLNKAREPFLGIYISFAAHFPYFDYGEEYRIMQEDGRLISRYYNNLNLLDHMIKRVYENLKEQGLLDRTLLVVIGDHGQAFGQHHPNNFMHYRYSYNENLETPAVLYQPALFKPKTFEFPTSHVDVLPTLLDAMRVFYPPMVFDGESLFNYESRQKSIFFYGYEESVSSLNPHLIKVQYSLKKNRCWAFDLKHDPDEENPLDCSLYPLQLETLHKFVNDHNTSLLRYCAGLRKKRGWADKQQPVVKETN